MGSLKTQTVSGVKWVVAASFVQRVISIATTVILARILSPADFGLFALAFVMIDGFGLFKSLGVDSALVRQKEDNTKAADTAFFLIPAMGMILSLSLFISAPLGGRFLNNPQVTSIIRALAVIFVISCFAKVPQTILYRRMQFKYKSIAEVSSMVTYSATAVFLAFKGWGVWSLVIAYILRALLQGSMEWYFSKWRPTFQFDKTLAFEMFHFGKYILASSLIAFLYTNLDNIVIGKLLGTTMLGYYAISLNLANFLSQYLLDKVGTIMYPAYSRIQDEPDEIKRAMVTVIRYVSYLAVPFAIGLSVFAPEILGLLLGHQWIPAAPILRIIAFVGLLRAFGTVIWPAFLAKGRSAVDFFIGLAQVAVFFLLIIPLALRFQLIGVGIAALIAAVVSFLTGAVRINHMLQLTAREIAGALRPAVTSGLCMLAIALLLVTVHPALISRPTGFILAALISTAVYLGGMYLTNRTVFAEIRELLA